VDGRSKTKGNTRKRKKGPCSPLLLFFSAAPPCLHCRAAPPPLLSSSASTSAPPQYLLPSFPVPVPSFPLPSLHKSARPSISLDPATQSAPVLSPPPSTCPVPSHQARSSIDHQLTASLFPPPASSNSSCPLVSTCPRRVQFCRLPIAEPSSD
jgi:hypothetical protein